MKRLLTLFILLYVLWATASASELAQKLSSPDYVLMIRHAYAPGVGDPPGYSLDRCDTQRVLNQEGKNQAVRIGQWLRAQGLSEALVFTSIWCRCQETASLLRLARPEVLQALASFFDQGAKAPQQNRDLQAFIARQRWLKGAKALVLVTHHVNIREFTGENIGSGDLILVRVDEHGRALSHRAYPSP